MEISLVASSDGMTSVVYQVAAPTSTSLSALSCPGTVVCFLQGPLSEIDNGSLIVSTVYIDYNEVTSYTAILTVLG